MKDVLEKCRSHVLDLLKEGLGTGIYGREHRRSSARFQKRARLAAIPTLQQSNPKPYQRKQCPFALSFSRARGGKHLLTHRLRQILPDNSQVLAGGNILYGQRQFPFQPKPLVLKTRGYTICLDCALSYLSGDGLKTFSGRFQALGAPLLQAYAYCMSIQYHGCMKRVIWIDLFAQ